MSVPKVLLQIRSIVRETDQASSFVLDSASDPTPGLIYKAGQFLTFIFASGASAPVRRSYSISSSPAINEPLTITVKRVINGAFSRRLIDEAKEGDMLESTGASGFFLLPDLVESTDQYVFFAAGSGISPVFSLIKTLLSVHSGTPVLLIYSNTTPATTIFYSLLLAWQERYQDRFIVKFLFSESADLAESRLTPEYLEDLMVRHEVSTSALFYSCGPPAYMRMIQFKLLTMGISPAQLRREIFQSEKIIEAPRPPDLRPWEVSIAASAATCSFTVQYPSTILQAARVAGVSIPYSCESGQCGTCVATCVSGSVWMARNEVLTDKDLQAGLVLTCTGFPVDGPVTLAL